MCHILPPPNAFSSHWGGKPVSRPHQIAGEGLYDWILLHIRNSPSRKTKRQKEVSLLLDKLTSCDKIFFSPFWHGRVFSHVSPHLESELVQSRHRLTSDWILWKNIQVWVYFSTKAPFQLFGEAVPHCMKMYGRKGLNSVFPQGPFPGLQSSCLELPN